MDYRALLKRLDAAKQHNSNKVAVQLRIRIDEIDSLTHSIRCLVNLNDQYRGQVKGLQETIAELGLRIKKHDEKLSEKHSTIDHLRGQIIQHELRIQHLETELGDEAGGDEMEVWHRRLVEEQRQKQQMRARV